MSNEKKMEWRDIMIIILIILLVLAGLFAGIFYNKYKDAEGEIVIWNDSLTTYKNKYNEEYLAKNTYILKAELLLAYNDELYAEYKSLLDNPIVITKTQIVTKFDTIRMTIDSILIGDNDYVEWSWSAKDSCWYAIKGASGVNHNDLSDVYTEIDELKINSNITLDVIDDGNQLKVIAKSDNPYIELTDMQSVVIDPLNSPTIQRLNKPKRWGFGPYIGVGVNVGYDFVNKGACVGVGGSIGFSIHYDLIQW